MAVGLSESKFRVYFLDRLHVIDDAGTTAWLCAGALFIKGLEWKQQIQQEDEQKLRSCHRLTDYLKQEELICFKVQELNFG